MKIKVTLFVMLIVVSVVLVSCNNFQPAQDDTAAQSDDRIAATTTQVVLDDQASRTTPILQNPPTTEREALVALYRATGGDNWYNNKNWLSDQSVCTWDGITCADGHVTEIDLDKNNLQGKLPPEISQLADLKKMDLSSNEITELPPEIGQLTKLLVLDLDSNQFAELPPDIGQLPKLQMLHLSSNQLAELPLEICQLANLQYMDLRGNQLMELPPEIGQLTNLERLYLAGNPLSALPPQLCQSSQLEMNKSLQDLCIEPTATSEPDIVDLVDVRISMMDESHGWAFDNDSLLRTGDGGETWKDVTYPCERSYNNEFLLDSDIAWVTCEQNLVRTEDGGETWDIMGPVGSDSRSYGIDDACISAGAVAVIPTDIRHGGYIYEFLDANNGFRFEVYGRNYRNGIIYQTRDGGLSWNGIAQYDFQHFIFGHQFYNNQRLFIDIGVVSCMFHLYYSDDFMETWSESSLPIIWLEETYDYCLILGLPVFFGNDGVIPMRIYNVDDELDGLALYITENNGASWMPSAELLTDDRSSEAQILSLHDVIVQCGNDLCVTSDGGQTWKTIQTNLPSPNIEDMEYIQQFEFISPLIGWANIGDGRLYKTSDGGHTWVELPAIIIPSE